MIDVTIDITGTTTLLMHADTLADPLAPETKAFKKTSGKRVKTDDDHLEMARLEYLAGLYVVDGLGIAVPSRNLTKCLIEGARITKSGAKVERGLTMTATDFPLVYDGPTDPEELQRNRRFVSRMTVKVGTARTVRCRPQFIDWAFTATAMVDPTVLSPDELGDIASNAGQMIGLGDYRKGGGFGRFSAVVKRA
jgi:hypothetical protein